MAELTPKERLQPSLLDRLTDDEPGAKKEAREARVLSARQLRRCVLRDLDWLFNTGNLSADPALDRYPLVRRSVVNYGLARAQRPQRRLHDAEGLRRHHPPSDPRFRAAHPSRFGPRTRCGSARPDEQERHRLRNPGRALGSAGADATVPPLRDRPGDRPRLGPGSALGAER